jgi:hypothetical protein
MNQENMQQVGTVDPVGDYIFKLLYGAGYLVSDRGITHFSNEELSSHIEIILWTQIRSITSDIVMKRIVFQLFYDEKDFVIPLKTTGEVPGVYTYLAGLFSSHMNRASSVFSHL